MILAIAPTECAPQAGERTKHGTQNNQDRRWNDQSLREKARPPQRPLRPPTARETASAASAPALAPLTLRWPKLRFQRVLRDAVLGAPARALSAVRIKRCREYSATRRISLPRRYGRSHRREPGARPPHRVLRQAASGQGTQQALTALRDKIAPSVFPSLCRLSRRNSTAPPNGYILSQYSHRDRI